MEGVRTPGIFGRTCRVQAECPRNLFFCGRPVPAGWRGRGKLRPLSAHGVPPFIERSFWETSPTDPGLLARRDFCWLGKLTGTGAAVKFINCFLGEILPSGDVDRREPALFSPAPGRAWRHPHLLQPSGEADDCRAGVRIRFAV